MFFCSAKHDSSDDVMVDAGVLVNLLISGLVQYSWAHNNMCGMLFLFVGFVTSKI